MASEAQVAGGHKATLNNPKVSDEAKQHSREVLDKEFNGDDGKRKSHSHSHSFHFLRIINYTWQES